MPAGSSFLIAKGMLSNRIEEIEFEGACYYRIGLRNQLLHAVHPLGWICELNLRIDGRSVPKEDVFFEIRGQWICTKQMHTIKDIYWYIAEIAHLNIRNKFDIPTGEHEIECEFVASQLEVSTQFDVKKLWPRRSQVVAVKAVF
jgi:hypothetical protein